MSGFGWEELEKGISVFGVETGKRRRYNTVERRYCNAGVLRNFTLLLFQ